MGGDNRALDRIFDLLCRKAHAYAIRDALPHLDEEDYAQAALLDVLVYSRHALESTNLSLLVFLAKQSFARTRRRGLRRRRADWEWEEIEKRRTTDDLWDAVRRLEYLRDALRKISERSDDMDIVAICETILEPQYYFAYLYRTTRRGLAITPTRKSVAKYIGVSTPTLIAKADVLQTHLRFMLERGEIEGEAVGYGDFGE